MSEVGIQTGTAMRRLKRLKSQVKDKGGSSLGLFFTRKSGELPFEVIHQDSNSPNCFFTVGGKLALGTGEYGQ